MNRILKKCYLGLLQTFFLVSCQESVLKDSGLLRQYQIKLATILKDQRIGQIGPAINFDGGMEGVSLYPSWEYEELPLLFF